MTDRAPAASPPTTPAGRRAPSSTSRPAPPGRSGWCLVFVWSAGFFAVTAAVAFLLYPARSVTAVLAAENQHAAVHM